LSFSLTLFAQLLSDFLIGGIDILFFWTSLLPSRLCGILRRDGPQELKYWISAFLPHSTFMMSLWFSQ
jgi:hypothetical protein